MSWYSQQPEAIRDRIRRYGNTDGNLVGRDFIRFAMSSIARYAIFPIQDLMLLGSEARMNTPGVAAANWAFRYTSDMLTDEAGQWLLLTTQLYNR
jgi:4-alpha-glucanotransferase